MGNPLILIVSNKRNRSEQVSLWLQDYDLIYATTSEEAYNIFYNNYYKIRVVLLDLVLPDYSGIDLMLRLKKLSTLSEIIIVSDQYDIKVAIECVKKGAFDYLPYPFSDFKLNQTISQAIQNIDHHSFEPFSNNEIDTCAETKMSFLNDIVITKRLYERSLTKKEMEDLLKSDRHALVDIQSCILKTIDERYHLFNLPKVLLIEEDPIYRNLTKSFLHEQVDVIMSETIKSAKKWLELEPKIDIVILELFFSDGSGIDLIPLIQKKHPDSEIIIITDYDNLSEATKLIRLGVNNFFNKPIIKKQLIEAVHSAMETIYKTKIIPHVTKTLVEHTLSEEDKYCLIKELAESKKAHDKPLLMKDLYSYFPELRQLCLPDSLSISNIDLQKDISGFVDELRMGLSQGCELVSV